MTSIKSRLSLLIKRILSNTFGINVSKESLRKLNSETWIENMHFKTILDVGANEGSMTKFFRRLAPDATIYAFEPIPFLADKIKADNKEDSNLIVVNSALGEKDETLKMFLNPFHYSSSILPLGETAKNHLPHVDNQMEEIEIKVVKLDNLIDVTEIQKPCLIKVDVQGFEDRVIDGGIKIFKEAEVIIIEMAVQKGIYEGESLFNDIYQRLINLGFEFRGVYDQYNSPKNGMALYCDGIFMRMVNP